MDKSYVQVYTGNGKGKTTAAIGLAVRAAGRGKTVKIVQFLKGRDTGEMFVLDKIKGIDLMRVFDCKKFFNAMTQEEKAKMRTAATQIQPVIKGWLGQADLVILDEALGAIACDILKMDEILSIIDGRKSTEIVLTGRNLPDDILKKAHLVTEMKDIKHYMNDGVVAREGIEY